jgi:hypothetical protein
VGSVAVVQRAQTDTAAPLVVPPLGVVAAEPRWPAELLPVPQPPQPTAAYQRCSATASTSGISGVYVLLEGSSLRLQVEDPL